MRRIFIRFVVCKIISFINIKKQFKVKHCCLTCYVLKMSIDKIVFTRKERYKKGESTGFSFCKTGFNYSLCPDRPYPQIFHKILENQRGRIQSQLYESTDRPSVINCAKFGIILMPFFSVM